RSSCDIVTGRSGFAICFGAAGTGADTGGAGLVVVVTGGVVTVGPVTVGPVAVGAVTVGAGGGTTVGTTGGGATGSGVSRCLRANARSSSACAVSGSLARKEATSCAPISPAAATARICGAAQEVGFDEDAAA